MLAGVLVAHGAFAVLAALSAIIASQADADTIGSNLRSLGIPTSSSEWGDIGTLAGIASLAAMLLGPLWVACSVSAGTPSWPAGRSAASTAQTTANGKPATSAPTPPYTPRPDDRDQAAPGQSERDRSDGSRATRVD